MNGRVLYGAPQTYTPHNVRQNILVNQNPSTAVAVSNGNAKPAKSPAKRIGQMAGAAALSLGLVCTFGLPAYAVSSENNGLRADGFTDAAPGQVLKTNLSDEAVPAIVDTDGAVDSEVLAQERQEKADKKAADAAKKAAEAAAAASAAGAGALTPVAGATPSAPTGQDVPAGVGAAGIVSAALAQLGQFQDCTALVERSLQAVGIPAGDLGTQIHEYTALGGVEVFDGAYAPGDVLVWSGRHVAVYIGNGQAVHGGYGGNQTVVAGAFLDGTPSGVVRFG